MVILGVDVGSHTGLAVYDREQGKLLSLSTVDGPGAFEAIVALTQSHPITTVIIERPNSLACIWQRNVNEMAMRRIAKNVGQCIGLADELARRLAERGIHGKQISPIKRGTKWPVKFWREQFGWTGKCSEHARDAAVIARWAE